MDLGPLLTAATIWGALIAYTVAESGRAQLIRGLSCGRARNVWSLGCLLYAAHVWSAFQFQHDWSHEAAYAHTAEQTAALVGLVLGGGIYVNYLFTALWVEEVVWWWVAPTSYDARSVRVRFAVRAVFLFMIVNGAVVFVDGPMRWLGAGIVAVLLVVWWKGVDRQAV